jgi:hypothetical protein
LARQHKPSPEGSTAPGSIECIALVRDTQTASHVEAANHSTTAMPLVDKGMQQRAASNETLNNNHESQQHMTLEGKHTVAKLHVMSCC